MRLIREDIEAPSCVANFRKFHWTLLDYMKSTRETNEIHSMAMEVLTWPWMEKFFGGEADRYRYMHAGTSLAFLPWGACGDHFQLHGAFCQAVDALLGYQPEKTARRGGFASLNDIPRRKVAASDIGN